jgi:hypothetical protein
MMTPLVCLVLVALFCGKNQDLPINSSKFQRKENADKPTICSKPISAAPAPYSASGRRFLFAAPASHVVVSQPQDNVRALMGELPAETLQFGGIKRYIVDGGMRDMSFARKNRLSGYRPFLFVP